MNSIPFIARLFLASAPVVILLRLAFGDMTWLANVDDVRWFIAKLAIGWFITGLWLVIIGEDQSQMRETIIRQRDELANLRLVTPETAVLSDEKTKGETNETNH